MEKATAPAATTINSSIVYMNMSVVLSQNVSVNFTPPTVTAEDEPNRNVTTSDTMSNATVHQAIRAAGTPFTTLSEDLFLYPLTTATTATQSVMNVIA